MKKYKRMPLRVRLWLNFVWYLGYLSAIPGAGLMFIGEISWVISCRLRQMSPLGFLAVEILGWPIRFLHGYVDRVLETYVAQEEEWPGSAMDPKDAEAMRESFNKWVSGIKEEKCE
jgi:hypothetical protein